MDQSPTIYWTEIIPHILWINHGGSQESLIDIHDVSNATRLLISKLMIQAKVANKPNFTFAHTNATDIATLQTVVLNAITL